MVQIATNRNGVKFAGVDTPRKTAGYAPMSLGHGLWFDDYDKRFTWWDVPRMKRDPQVLMGLRIIEAPMHGVKLGVAANSPQIESFVDKQINLIWQRGLRKIIKMIEYGHMCGEIEYKLKNKRYNFNQLHSFHPVDCRALRNERTREIVGARVRNIHGNGKRGDVDLAFPNAFWIVNEAEYGQPYGFSRLAGAFSPWMEKAGRHGALDIRRLWFLKNAYNSGTLRYPNEDIELSPGKVVSGQDLAREIMEKLETGGILVLPNSRVAKGNGDFGDYLWEYEPPTVNGSSLADILEYPGKLDRDIFTGEGIPNELIEAGDKGSWSGRSIPAQVFFSSLDQIVANIIDTCDRLIIRPLVLINFGKKADFEITHESLAKQVENEPDSLKETVRGQDTNGGVGADPQPNPMGAAVGAMKGKVPAQRMSLNGIIDRHPELVEKIRKKAIKLFPVEGETRFGKIEGKKKRLSNNKPHKYGTTQINLSDAGRGISPNKRLKEMVTRIADEDLAEDGKENEFHITVKYGLHRSNPNSVRDAVKDFNGWVQYRLGKTSIFPASEGRDYDVVKIDVDSPDLHDLNEMLAALPHTDTHPDYRPHVTLAYVKPGLGKKYADMTDVDGWNGGCDQMVFSDKRNNKTEIPLANRPSRLSKDAHGHEHKSKGEGGGQFAKTSTGDTATSQPDPATTRQPWTGTGELPAEFPERTALRDKLKTSAASNGVDPERLKFYHQKLDETLDGMTPGMVKRLDENLKGIEFHNDIASVKAAYNQIPGAKLGTNENIGGFYLPHTGILHVDGGDDAGGFQDETTRGLQAHELGHALDGMNDISDSPEWQAAWQREIKPLRLSAYAQTNESEGFAEFARVATRWPQDAQKYFPACWAVWKSFGLVGGES